MINVEALLVAELGTVAGFPAVHTDVPAQRPTRFITVERVGGGPEDVRDLPLVAVQCWAASRYEASELAADVATELKRLALTHPNVARVDIQSIVNFPDPDSRQARYQVTASLVTKK